MCHPKHFEKQDARRCSSSSPKRRRCQTRTKDQRTRRSTRNHQRKAQPPTSRTTHPKILTAETDIFIEKFLKILASTLRFVQIHISIFFCCYTRHSTSRINCKLRFVIFCEKLFAGRTAVLPCAPLKGVYKQDARRGSSPSTKRRCCRPSTKDQRTRRRSRHHQRRAQPPTSYTIHNRNNIESYYLMTRSDN